MKCGLINRFKGKINGVMFDDEQDYNYLREFIENLEGIFNLEINSKEATEFLHHELYEGTENLYNVETEDYYKAHCEAVNNLSNSILIITKLLSYLNEKVII